LLINSRESSLIKKGLQRFLQTFFVSSWQEATLYLLGPEGPSIFSLERKSGGKKFKAWSYGLK